MKKFLINKLLLAAFVLMTTGKLYAGGLMVTPSRLEFKGNTTSQEVKLINKNDQPVTYRISLQHLRMDENGNYKEIAENETNVQEKFADDLLRFSPRKITLKANEVQTIRVAIKKDASLADGEYRSHLLFREEPAADFKQANNVEAATAKKDDKTISVVLKPLFGISIPVIVNNGKSEANSAIENLAIKSDEKDKNKKLVAFDLTRSGNASLYGNVSVTFKQNKTGKEHDVGALNSLSVFYPYPKRNVTVALNLPKDIKLTDGVLSVKYSARNDDGKSDKKVFSKSSLTLN